MTPSSDRYVPDELKIEGTRLQLLAYERERVVWIGLSSPSGGGAIGLHTGSGARDVETTASIGPDWSVAWGSISPRVARAEIRNDDGEAFPVRILALPAELSRDDRAVLLNSSRRESLRPSGYRACRAWMLENRCGAGYEGTRLLRGRKPDSSGAYETSARGPGTRAGGPQALRPLD